MTTTKTYKVGDIVWIYGISRSNTKPTQGKVIKVVDLSSAGYSVGDHYIIEIPSHIEPVLEVRTWHNISQDSKGPVGSLRDLGNIESTIKFVSSVGFAFDDDPTLDTDPLIDGDDEIDPDIIYAAMEKSQQDNVHAPLNLKEPKPKRRHYSRKKKV